MAAQPSILAALPPHALFLWADAAPEVGRDALLEAVAALSVEPHLLVGLGASLLPEGAVPGMRPLPPLTGAGVHMPATPTHLLLRVTGADPGEVLHHERALMARLPRLLVRDRAQAFTHRGNRDLSGYEDGTENPDAATAPSVALAAGQGDGLDGGSVVATQRWVHDFVAFDGMTRAEQDHAVGRDRDSNDELDDAPPSAHVKRTAQEDFEPEAFVWRRSMPWHDPRGAGLVFVAFAASLDPFEAQCRRMIGLDDGIVDGLFRFTVPVTGGAHWCPPVRDGHLDLRALAAG